MIGLKNKEIILLPYTTEWKRLYQNEESIIKLNLGDLILDIQHIGSTSIPNIHAKPILDIAIAVHSFDSAKETIPLLSKLGYIYRGENGIERRHYFVKGSDNIRTHHLHMLEIKSSDWINNIKFRDILIAHQHLANEYEQLKIALWKKFGNNRVAYTEAKTPFIQKVLSQF